MTVLTNHWRGLLLVALGLGTVLGAHFLLDTCADAGRFLTSANGAQIHMGCTWTERAVQGIGALTAVIGLISMFSRQSARALSLTAGIAGLLIVATPLWLIPTCKMMNMPCNMSLKPGALLLGGLIAFAGVLGSLSFARLEGAGGARGVA